jgi:hypothetical protein
LDWTRSVQYQSIGSGGSIILTNTGVKNRFTHFMLATRIPSPVILPVNKLFPTNYVPDPGFSMLDVPSSEIN